MKRVVPIERAGLLRRSPSEGLSTAEAAALAAAHGTNVIAESPPGSLGRLARETVADPMIWFLAATSLLFAAIGQYQVYLVVLMITFGVLEVFTF